MSTETMKYYNFKLLSIPVKTDTMCLKVSHLGNGILNTMSNRFKPKCEMSYNST